MLTTVITNVLIGLLSALGGWLVRHFQEYLKDKAAADTDEKQTAAAQKALEDAKTKEDLENAAKGIADNFGK